MPVRITRRTLLAAAAASALRAGFPGRSAIGANTAIDGYGIFDAIALLHKIGFPAIEIHTMGVPEATPGCFPGFQFDRIPEAMKRRIRAALAPFEEVTAHLPYSGLHYFSKESAEASIRTVDTALDGAAYFGAKVAVLHPMAPEGYSADEGARVMLRQIRQWGDRARERRVRLALETGYAQSVHEFLRLVWEVDHPWVGGALDVGHQSHYKELVARVKPEERSTPAGIRAYNDIDIAIVEGLQDKLFHLHVHDIDPKTWKEHQPLRFGFIDYPRLIAKLREVGYTGLLILEIGAPAAEMPRDLADAKRRLEGWLG